FFLSTRPNAHRNLRERLLFRVEILFNGRKHFVLRRHSEFQTLHRKLKKILHPPDFPSKRSTHLRTKPLEQRRQQLEDYIQDIIYQYEEVPQVLLDFLHVKHFHSGNKISSLEYLFDSPSGLLSLSGQLQHQRVVGFCGDPYLLESPSDLPDIVMDGVLQGFFPQGSCTMADPVKHVTAPIPCGSSLPGMTVSQSLACHM
uniref:Sorting nexin 22 n=1 Tax=Salmo trutta TaxID=8032 RepID=A0A674BS41_SALTR